MGSKEKTIGANGLIGEGCQLRGVSLGRYTEVGPGNVFEDVSLGDWSYTGQHCILQNVEVGKFANIAAMVRIGPTNHPVDRPTLHHITYRRRMYGLAERDDEELFRRRRERVARIGHDTWIGHGAIVMPGVSMGDGSVLGSGAVLTRDLPPYAIAVGVPARVLRPRFDPETAAALAEIAWWDWDYERIKRHLEALSGDTAAFVAAYRRGELA